MSARPFLHRRLRWSAWSGAAAGLEHVDVEPADGGTDFRGVVIGRTDGTPFGLSYELRVDSLWRIREAQLQTTSGRILHLESNGQGRWRENGADQPALQGCLDIDIEATPLTNTLPIRRLEWEPGESVEIRLCYVTVPDLTASARIQRYTAVTPGALYRFESPDSGFSADLPVDGDGFVIDYPGLFRRLAADAPDA